MESAMTKRARSRLAAFRIAGAVALAGLMTLAAACGSSSPNSAAGVSGTDSSPSQAASSTIAMDPAIRKLFPASILAKGGLTLATGNARAPFSMYDPPSSTHLTGADVQLGQDVAALAGLHADFKILSLNSQVPALDSGQVDAIWYAQVPTPTRLKAVSFVDMALAPLGILVKHGNPANVSQVSDFCGGKTVAIVQGSIPSLQSADAGLQKCKALGKKPFHVKTYPDETSPQLAVETGQVDGMLDNGATTQYVAKSTNGGTAYTSVLDTKTIPEQPIGYAFGTSADQLRQAVAAALQKLMDDGTYAAVYGQYGLNQLEVKTATPDPKL
jgi:polar amino acid transport system substrate-binding protein